MSTSTMIAGMPPLVVRTRSVLNMAEDELYGTIPWPCGSTDGGVNWSDRVDQKRPQSNSSATSSLAACGVAKTRQITGSERSSSQR